MARRAFPWPLLTILALLIALGAMHPLAEVNSTRTTAIEQSADGHVDALANNPLQGGDPAAVLGQWSDDDPDDVLPVGILAAPAGTSAHGRRVGNAVVRQRLFCAAFPRGPPSA